MWLVRRLPLLFLCLWTLTTTNTVLLRFFGLKVQYVEESGLDVVSVQTENRWLESVRRILQVREAETIEEARKSLASNFKVRGSSLFTLL
jgi:hypothetical protein